MEVTAKAFVDLALYYEGYREKNHASANLQDFYADAGDGNHTIFQQVAVGWTGDQWCQYFVDGIAVMLTGSREAAKELLCQEKLSRMTGYTPDGAACFIDAGRWRYNPEVGDIVYFWSQSKGRIGHVGIVYKVDSDNKVVYTIEGNTNTYERPDGGVETNGGTVGRHAYDYSNVGTHGAAVQGFGRPRYISESNDSVYIDIGGAMKVKFNSCKRGDSGNSVLLVQEILKSRGIYTGELDREFGPLTEDAVIRYQAARIAAGANIGGADGKPDGEVGPATMYDLLGLPKV